MKFKKGDRVYAPGSGYGIVVHVYGSHAVRVKFPLSVIQEYFPMSLLEPVERPSARKALERLLRSGCVGERHMSVDDIIETLKQECGIDLEEM